MKLVADIGGQHHEFPITKRSFIIGRGKYCDVTILSPTISRRHVSCTIPPERDDLILVRDLGTRNGTFVGGGRITAASVTLGQELRLGNVVVRFLEGGPPLPAVMEQAAEPVPVVMADMGAVPEAAGGEVTLGDEPTPLDERFAPESSPSASSGEEVGPVPALLTAPGSRPAKSMWLSRRLKIALVVFAALFVSIVVATLATGRKKQVPEMPRSEYNRHMEMAVTLFEQGQFDECVRLLETLRRQPVKDGSHTAAMMLAAIKPDLKLRTMEGFQNREWREEAEKCWRELSRDTRSTEPVRKLAAARVAWIARESQNMYAYTRFLELLEKREWENAVQVAATIAVDSLFYKGVEQKVSEARGKHVEDLRQDADRAFVNRNWSRALNLYQALSKLLGGVPADIDEKMRACHQGQRDAEAIARAEKLIAGEKFAEAAEVLNTVRPDGAYADELRQLSRRLTLAKVTLDARARYDAGRGDEALRVLEQAGEANSELYKRIRAVIESWQKAQEAMKTADFAKAQADCQNIIAIETTPANFYRREAEKLLRSWKEEAGKMALRLVARGQEAWQERKYAEARRFFEEAVRTDPQGQHGREQIRELKREAVLEFNRALNLREKDPILALKIFREVKARLLPEDPYYNEAEVWIRTLSAAP